MPARCAAAATPSTHPARVCTAARSLAGRLVAAIGLSLLGGCAQLAYYGQSIGGHVQLLAAARPVPDVLADPTTGVALREQLTLSQRIRDFAVQTLQLPDNGSYRRYADLQRRAALWNVVAAPPLSLELHSWCYVLVGCVNYRGYFSRSEAALQAQALRVQGLDVVVYPVAAYSTLGWLNWLGGDPLLNTFISDAEGDLARLIFHELAHQVVYVGDDSMFNESFATAVARLGGRLWLEQHASAQVRAQDASRTLRRQQFRTLVARTRDQLTALYGRTAPAPTLAEKARILDAFRADYAQLKTAWGGAGGYDAQVAQANNAMFGAYATYDALVPGFEALYRQSAGDWGRFFAAVRQLAARPREERRQALRALAAGLSDAARGALPAS